MTQVIPLRGLSSITIRPSRSVALALGGFAVALLAVYPGWMSSDSVDQYRQALSLNFHDWHPPVMAAIWSVTNTVVPGPLGMLLLQLSLYWGALLLLASSAHEVRPKWSWIFVALGFLPMTINFAGVLWKDAAVAIYLLMAVAGLVKALLRDERAPAWIPLLLFLAAASRWNALPAMLPLLFVWTQLRWPHLSLAWVLLTSTALAGVIAASIGLVNYKVLEAERTSPWQAVLLHDLAAIGCMTGKKLIPKPFVKVGAGNKPICESYQPAVVDPLFFPADAPLIFRRDGLDELRRAWFDAVWANPSVYIRHRLNFFSDFLRIGHEFGDYVLHNSIDPNDLGLRHTPNALSLTLEKYVKSFAATPLMKPWTWLLTLVLLSGLAFLLRRRFALIVLLSGLLYFLPYLLVGVAPSLRYAYWSIWASLVGTVILILNLERSDDLEQNSAKTRLGRSAEAREVL